MSLPPPPLPDPFPIPADPADLELSGEAMRALAADVVERAIRHVESLPSQPSCGDVEIEATCRALARAEPPPGPVPPGPLLDRLFDDWIPRSFTTAGPGYLAYIPGGGIFPAAIADLISGTTNRFTGILAAAPALVQLEANALDWLRGWMDLPPSARGLFTTGGSSANLAAIVCARERLLGTALRDGVLYASDQAHHSVAKSAKIAGILPDRVRSIPTGDDFRMRLDLLEERIAADRGAGLVPFLVVSSAGTTNTGAVDPLAAAGALCRRLGLWHHVDGAYGGFFQAVPALRPLLAGLADADSVTLDPHKGLFLPYGTGCLLVRDGSALREAYAVEAGYLPPASEGDDLYDPARFGPDLSRGFPGLRVWLTFQLFGAPKLLAAIAEKRALAVEAARQVAATPGVVMDAPPDLSLFAFHLARDGWGREREDAATRELVRRVTARGRVMITGCTAKGRFLARVCVLSFRTRAPQMATFLEHFREEAAAILAD